MEGIIFLWIMWGCWVYTTFLMSKGIFRFKASALILIFIITSHSYLSFMSLKITVAFIILFLFAASLFKIKKKRQILYYLLSTFVISLSYLLYHIYLLYDPAIRLIINPWMFILAILIINRLLVESIQLRISTLILGFIHGEVMRVIIFFHYLHTIGTYHFFDLISISFVILLGWYGVESLVSYFEELFKMQYRKKLIK